MPYRLQFLTMAACLGLSFATPASAFDLSDSYVAGYGLVPGTYACVSGLDFSQFTWTFELAANGRYVVEGIGGEGIMAVSPSGEVAIESGPFASDATTSMSAMATTRVSDGNDVIILRYDFGDVVTDDYCARLDRP